MNYLLTVVNYSLLFTWQQTIKKLRYCYKPLQSTIIVMKNWLPDGIVKLSFVHMSEIQLSKILFITSTIAIVIKIHCLRVFHNYLFLHDLSTQKNYFMENWLPEATSLLSFVHMTYIHYCLHTKYYQSSHESLPFLHIISTK